ncbi:ABC transporter ATP-binding protein [Anaerocolumna sp. MB42-C2]|uniref:ABC transporter ATP-binding protein n=1 Tax=Anaerocolumna sp. MB42-C2 TaxID=3070997 RepID=UPI0027DEECFB|nr:ABC transporter ATP-binding protein [Anaerocolumna sp. MB42-C2]WMJ88199.1 ABC transporter ATP-binding protein [Anaerocolumna sp. MB42-C2]
MPRMNIVMQSKANDSKNTIRTLGTYLFPYKLQIVAVLIFAAVSTLFSILGPKLLGKIITKLADGLVAFYLHTGLYMDFDYMGKMTILLILLYFISTLTSYIQNFIMTRVSMEVTFKLRKEISQKMQKIPLNYYDTRTYGEVLSRITNDVDLVSQTLNQSLTQLITSIATIIGVFCMMLSISVLMTITALIVIPISLVIVNIIIKNSQGFFKSQQKSLGSLNGHVEEMYSGHNVIQAFNRQAESVEQFEIINKDLCESAWKSQFVTSIMQPIMNFVGNLGYVLICILGGYLAVKKVVEIGDIQSFIQYMRNFTMPITQLASISNTLQQTIAAAERVFEFLEEEEEADDADSIPDYEFHGNVEFKNIFFGYNPEKLIIHNFSANIKQGQKVAIVGPTGAGKTTLVKLLMRFYDINSGEILIDGHNIFDFKRNDLRSLFGMVLQETWLYNASILDNIKYGTFDASKEEVIAAAKAAHCDEFIRTLPDGYDTILNEEASNISQGQKQLFTIARVILANPKILILDEATSSIDTQTEILIQKAMDSLMTGRTSFVIAHRLSTIKNSDLILVLKDGDIIEQGNHDELLALEGFYAGLYNSQFE